MAHEGQVERDRTLHAVIYAANGVKPPVYEAPRPPDPVAVSRRVRDFARAHNAEIAKRRRPPPAVTKTASEAKVPPAKT